MKLVLRAAATECGVLAAAKRMRMAPSGKSAHVRGGTEQYYVRAARRFRFDQLPDALAAMTSNLAEELAGDRQALFNQRVLRLTARQATALSAHLDAVVNDLEPAVSASGGTASCRHRPA